MEDPASRSGRSCVPWSFAWTARHSRRRLAAPVALFLIFGIVLSSGWIDRAFAVSGGGACCVAAGGGMICSCADDLSLTDCEGQSGTFFAGATCAQVPCDCNNNQLCDAVELSADPGGDCDASGLPDACEGYPCRACCDDSGMCVGDLLAAQCVSGGICVQPFSRRGEPCTSDAQCDVSGGDGLCLENPGTAHPHALCATGKTLCTVGRVGAACLEDSDCDTLDAMGSPVAGACGEIPQPVCNAAECLWDNGPVLNDGGSARAHVSAGGYEALVRYNHAVADDFLLRGSGETPCAIEAIMVWIMARPVEPFAPQFPDDITSGEPGLNRGVNVIIFADHGLPPSASCDADDDCGTGNACVNGQCDLWTDGAKPGALPLTPYDQSDTGRTANTIPGGVVFSRHLPLAGPGANPLSESFMQVAPPEELCDPAGIFEAPHVYQATIQFVPGEQPLLEKNRRYWLSVQHVFPFNDGRRKTLQTWWVLSQNNTGRRAMAFRTDVPPFPDWVSHGLNAAFNGNTDQEDHGGINCPNTPAARTHWDFAFVVQGASIPAGSPPEGDGCDELNPIRAFAGVTPFDTTLATDSPQPWPTCGAIHKDLWFLHEAACDGELTLATCGSAFDTTLAVYGGPDCSPAPTERACAADSEASCVPPESGTGASVVRLPVSKGDPLWIRAGGAGTESSGLGLLSITCLPVCGLPLNGPCCEDQTLTGTGSAGCEIEPCCVEVCTIDPGCCGDSGGVWGASCALLAQSSPSCQCPCELACPEGAIQEGEACGASEINAGCDAPSVLPEAFQPLACNQTVCGTLYATQSVHDVDWYVVQAPDADASGSDSIALTLNANLPVGVSVWEAVPRGTTTCSATGAEECPAGVECVLPVDCSAAGDANCMAVAAGLCRQTDGLTPCPVGGAGCICEGGGNPAACQNGGPGCLCAPDPYGCEDARLLVGPDPVLIRLATASCQADVLKICLESQKTYYLAVSLADLDMQPVTDGFPCPPVGAQNDYVLTVSDCDTSCLPGACCTCGGGCLASPDELACRNLPGWFQGEGTGCMDVLSSCQSQAHGCTDAMEISCGQSVALDLSDSTSSLPDQDAEGNAYSCAALGHQPVGKEWFSFTAEAQEASVRLCGSPDALGDPIIALYEGACCSANGSVALSLREIACDDDSCGPWGAFSRFCAEGLTVGATYFLQISNAREGAGGVYELELSCPCAGACCNELTAECSDGAVASNCQEEGELFSRLATCSEFVPPCGMGACCDHVSQACIDETLESCCGGPDPMLCDPAAGVSFYADTQCVRSDGVGGVSCAAFNSCIVSSGDVFDLSEIELGLSSRYDPFLPGWVEHADRFLLPGGNGGVCAIDELVFHTAHTLHDVAGGCDVGGGSACANAPTDYAAIHVTISPDDPAAPGGTGPSCEPFVPINGTHTCGDNRSALPDQVPDAPFSRRLDASFLVLPGNQPPLSGDYWTYQAESAVFTITIRLDPPVELSVNQYHWLALSVEQPLQGGYDVLWVLAPQFFGTPVRVWDGAGIQDYVPSTVAPALSLQYRLSGAAIVADCGPFRPFGDVFPPGTPAQQCQDGGNAIIDVDDILEVLRGFSQGFAAKPCSDLFPCGGNTIVDVDDILSILRAFSSNYDCDHPCPPGPCCTDATCADGLSQAQCAATGGAWLGIAPCGASQPCPTCGDINCP